MHTWAIPDLSWLSWSTLHVLVVNLDMSGSHRQLLFHQLLLAMENWDRQLLEELISNGQLFAIDIHRDMTCTWLNDTPLDTENVLPCDKSCSSALSCSKLVLVYLCHRAVSHEINDTHDLTLQSTHGTIYHSSCQWLALPPVCSKIC